MQARFTLAVLLGVVLIAAGACSGGGDDERIAELETDLAASEEALERERQAREAAKQEAAEAEQRADDAEGEAADAEQRADDAEEEIADAEEEIADAEEVQQQTQQQLEQAQQGSQQLQQQLTEAEQAELNARALTYIAEIETGGEPRSGVTVTDERDSTRKINPGGNFQAGSGAPAISGFTAHAYTRRASASEQTVYLYTNIQAPGTRPFWQLHGVNEITAAQAKTDFDPTPTQTARVVTVDGNLDYANGDTYNISVAGTYDGVSGTYTCTDCTIKGRDEDADTDITAADFDAGDWVMLADGERSFVAGSGDWDFKPGSINSGVRQKRDNEHLYFGIWVREPNVASQAHSYEYIFGGMTSVLTDNVPTAATAGTPLTNFGALTGTAEFRGGAIGKYVTRDQVGDNARIGTFNATATLTADFDDVTLEGRITNFRSPGQTLEGEWYLYLGDVTTNGDGVVTSEEPAAFTDGTVSSLDDDAVAAGEIGGVSVMGTWNATLYGSDNVVLSAGDRDDYPVASYPVANLAGIAGNFHASSTNAALAGAFGATPQ